MHNANADIFEIIKRAIMVAASDHPVEFLTKRDDIAQTLFSCKLINCAGCARCMKPSIDVSWENEEETIFVAEVLKIKEILNKSGDKSESVICDLLRRLRNMGVSVKILEATEIGKTVRVYQKHPSRIVCEIAKTLLKEWTGMVEWIKKESNSEQVCDAESKTMDSEDEASRMEEKLKETKRKLQKGYSENTKNKRKVLMMDLHEVTKQGLIPPKDQNNTHGKKQVRISGTRGGPTVNVWDSSEVFNSLGGIAFQKIKIEKNG